MRRNGAVNRALPDIERPGRTRFRPGFPPLLLLLLVAAFALQVAAIGFVWKLARDIRPEPEPADLAGEPAPEPVLEPPAEPAAEPADP